MKAFEMASVVDSISKRPTGNSFSIDSILQMDNKELIKIPNLTRVLDTHSLSNISPMLRTSFSNDKVMKCETALDLSVNISNVENERFRKSFEDHEQINNINGLYTNKNLSDEEHLAKVKRKQRYLYEQTESFETMSEGENIKSGDEPRNIQYSVENGFITSDQDYEILQTESAESDIETSDTNVVTVPGFHADGTLLNVDCVEDGELSPIDKEIATSNRSNETVREVANEQSVEESKFKGLV